MSAGYGTEGGLRLLAQARFGLAWYHNASDGNICYIGRHDSHGNREVLGCGRDWTQAIARADQTMESLRNFQICD